MKNQIMIGINDISFFVKLALIVYIMLNLLHRTKRKKNKYNLGSYQKYSSILSFYLPPFSFCLVMCFQCDFF